MDFSLALRRIFGKNNRRDTRGRDSRPDRRRRLFEELEARQMLDAASFYETLPEVITIAEPEQTFHYAIEGKSFEIIDASSVSGLTASLPTGPQVAFTVKETTTSGAVSTLGEVVVQLFNAEGEAPISSNHFLDLVADDYYEGQTIHRILKGFMFQGGSKNGHGVGGSGLAIVDEYSDVLTHSRRGVVAYANSGSGTSDAQFYVTFDAANYLNGSYNVFGYVVDGYDVLEKLENVSVVKDPTNPTSTEVSYPVNSYTLTDVHVVGENDVASGVLRLTTGEKTSGTTNVSVMATSASGETELQETTIYVGNDGLAEYLRSALDAIDFNAVAGNSITVALPETFGDIDVTYKVKVNDGAERYSLVSNFTPPEDASEQTTDPWTNFTVSTEKAGAQTLQLSITASVFGYLFMGQDDSVNVDESKYSDNYVFSHTTRTAYSDVVNEETGKTERVASTVPVTVIYKKVDLTATATQDVVFKPVAPTVAMTADSLASYGGVQYTASSFKDGEVVFTVEAYRTLPEEPLQNDGLIVAVDGTEYGYSRVSHTYDEETGLDKYELKLSCDHEFAEGLHTLTVQDALNAPTLSDATALSFNYDPKTIAFVDFPTTVTAKVGTAGSVSLKTNKTSASDGSQREDVAFSFVNSAAVASFLTISKDGVVSWTAPTEATLGSYDVDVQATDALGRVATKKLTVVVSGALAFADFTDTAANTGAAYLGHVSATGSSSSDSVIRYSLVGDTNLSINETTGVLSWAIPSDYLDAGVKTRLYDFTVKATELVPQEDGTYLEGLSAEKEFTLTINNAAYSENASLLPTWKTIAAQTATAGDSISIATVETAPTGVTATEYRFTTDVPEGMTIGSNGVVTWNPKTDFFGDTTTKSRTYNVGVAARSIVTADDQKVDYTDSTSTFFTLTLQNPNYEESAPVLGDLSSLVAQAGATYTATVAATDPNGTADRIVYAIGNATVPEGMTLNSTTGALSWAIPSTRLANNVSAQVYSLTVVATKQTRQEDGTYVDGKSASKTYDILIANSGETTLVSPTIASVAAQTVKAGKTLTFAVSATLPEGATATGVRYSFAADATVPTGMTIDAETGVVTYVVPSDYFASKDAAVESATEKVSVQAQTVVSKSTDAVNYGGSATSEVEIVVTRPDETPTFDTWGQWFSAWLDMTKSRYDSHAENLSTYLSSYLAAVEAREKALTTAVANRTSGKTTIAEFLQERAAAESTFQQATTTAQTTLRDADAEVESDYQATLAGMTAAYDNLKEANLTPTDAEAQKLAGSENVEKTQTSTWTGSSNFRIRNQATGVRVGLDLTTAMKMWRARDTKSAIYDEIYSNANFVNDVTASADAQ